MASSRKKPEATFEVRFVGANQKPESLSLRTVSETLSAIQDLASGRDPFVQLSVPEEKSIGLLDIRRGSAVYSCVAHQPDEAISNLSAVGSLLNEGQGDAADDVGLIAALKPIETLSHVARKLGCRVEVKRPGKGHEPLFVFEGPEYERLSTRVLIKGDTTVVGAIERVGGATEMRCLLRVPGRKRLLYCDVKDKNLVRRLGEHLYEDIAATGTAVWFHSSWRIVSFTINDFTQPRIKEGSISELRNAGLDAWDEIDDPEGHILKDMR